MVTSKLTGDRGLRQSALDADDGFDSYDGADNYSYESASFGGWWKGLSRLNDVIESDIFYKSTNLNFKN